jgi:Ca2+-binding EF-hand superfamily protein
MKLASAVVVLLLSGVAYADPPPGGQFRQQLLERFDRNHDGRLEKRERKQAARALRRIAKQMMRADRRQERRARFIQRFDLDGDGNVGPGEMPPELANRLRSRDRNGDGWLEPNEQP